MAVSGKLSFVPAGTHAVSLLNIATHAAHILYEERNVLLR